MADNRKVANSVVALGSAAVLAIYSAGYARTRAAADRFAQQESARRAPIRAPRPAQASTALSRVPAAPAAAEPAPPAAPADKVRVEASVPAAAPAKERSPAADVPAKPASQPAVASGATATRPQTTVAAATAPASIPVGRAAADTATSAPPAPSAPPAAPAPFTPVAPAAGTEGAATAYKDGTYYGWGSCRHGDIQAAVVIQDGRITEARVERCETRYSCNWVTPIPPRILLKQSTTYDYVSGATESSDAFQDAVAEALFQAK